MIEHVVYPPLEALEAIHLALVRDSGSPEGVRSPDALQACLARPEQLRAYAPEDVTIFSMAAALGYAIVKVHHPFVDGNKRVALMAVFVFLELNGYYLDVGEIDAANMILAVAAGECDETAFANWLEQHSYEVLES